MFSNIKILSLFFEQTKETNITQIETKGSSIFQRALNPREQSGANGI